MAEQQSEVYAATQEVPEMSAEDAFVHLHNFAHAQMSPLVLIGAMNRAKALIAEKDEALKQLALAKEQQSLLNRSIERLTATKEELTQAVDELTKRHATVSKMLSDAVGEMTGSTPATSAEG